MLARPCDPENEDELDSCDEGDDPRCLAAKRAGLETFTGRMTDGEDYFLFIGRRLAWLGLEHEQHSAQSTDHLVSVFNDVNAKLKVAGFSQPPFLHLQFIGQY